MPGSDRELRQVSIPDLHHYWPLVKPGLEQVRKHSADDWIAEDVYTAIRTGTSTLHVAFMDGVYVGFCVLTILQGYSSKALHIWCAYGEKGKNVVEKFEAELIERALSVGCRKLTFLSPRKGWGRRYTARTIQYEKDLIWAESNPRT